MKQSSINKVLACLPATRPEIAEKLNRTSGYVQQAVKWLIENKHIKHGGCVINYSGRFVQRYVPFNYPDEYSAGLLDIYPEKETA